MSSKPPLASASTRGCRVYGVLSGPFKTIPPPLGVPLRVPAKEQRQAGLRERRLDAVVALERHLLPQNDREPRRRAVDVVVSLDLGGNRLHTRRNGVDDNCRSAPGEKSTGLLEQSAHDLGIQRHITLHRELSDMASSAFPKPFDNLPLDFGICSRSAFYCSCSEKTRSLVVVWFLPIAECSHNGQAQADGGLERKRVYAFL